MDQLDRQELVRLRQSIGHVCGLRFEDSHVATPNLPGSVGLPADMKIKQTLALGCSLVIETLWEKLGLKKCLEAIAQAAGGVGSIGASLVSHGRQQALYAGIQTRGLGSLVVHRLLAILVGYQKGSQSPAGCYYRRQWSQSCCPYCMCRILRQGI